MRESIPYLLGAMVALGLLWPALANLCDSPYGAERRTWAFVVGVLAAIFGACMGLAL